MNIIVNKIKKVIIEHLFTGNHPENQGENFKVLAVVNHFYGQSKDWNGKSTSQKREVRKKIVETTLNELKKIPGIEIKVCGIKNYSLIDIDKDFSHLSDPKLLLYESIDWMATQVDNYDYFINIEDDILLPRETFENILEFDKLNPTNECFHPNRMEYQDGKEYCVDFKAWPGWKNLSKKYNGIELRVAENPHSAIAILSKEKLRYAKRNTNLKRRDVIIVTPLESAYVNLHSPFKLFRAYSNPTYHKVIHLDNWDPSLNS